MTIYLLIRPDVHPSLPEAIAVFTDTELLKRALRRRLPDKATADMVLLVEHWSAEDNTDFWHLGFMLVRRIVIYG